MKRKRSLIDRLFGLSDDFDEFDDFEDDYYRSERMRNENKIIIQTEEYVKGNTKEKETKVTLPQNVLETFKGMSEMYRVAENKRLANKEELLKSKDIKSVSEIIEELNDIINKFSNFKFDNYGVYEHSKGKERDKDERSNE